jgi:hypothetical protein
MTGEYLTLCCKTNYCGFSEILNKGSVENKGGNISLTNIRKWEKGPCRLNHMERTNRDGQSCFCFNLLSTKYNL